LVPDNIVPPYIVAHVDPEATITFAASGVMGTAVPAPTPPVYPAPFYDIAESQLCRDEVVLTLYGFSNSMAWQYKTALEQYSLTDPGAPTTFGLANSLVIRDAKRTQAEISTLAMKKTIHVSANYYQGAADAIAYRLILQCLPPSLTIGPLP